MEHRALVWDATYRCHPPHCGILGRLGVIHLSHWHVHRHPLDVRIHGVRNHQLLSRLLLLLKLQSMVVQLGLHERRVGIYGSHVSLGVPTLARQG